MDHLQRPTAVLAVDNETNSSFTRTTADGRSITYCLTVLQQPVRARACGQGAKSSADRRPVDPPPIVELTIHQGEKREEDITFTMNANYFLFATLEQARPIAQGRVPQERSAHPVLTGTPVAGMVYLDRPKPAGYFIFPDLSVRHEGKYRLSFSLYEELKNAKDDDKMDDGAASTVPGDDHVTHRLDVRSEPFHVYSAKKFPGLTESTSLSRMVADQGCRVRIRRDVRMRRREPKAGSKEWDDYEDETAAARARQQSVTPDPSVYPMVQTPQGYMEPVSRPRSASNASHHSLATTFTRRPSLQDIAPTYTQPQYPTAQQAYPQPPSSYGPQPGQPQFPPTQFVQQQQPSMQPPPPQYQSQALPAPPPFPAAPSAYCGPPPPSAPQQPQSQHSRPSHSYDATQPPPPPRAHTDCSAQPQTAHGRQPQHIPPPPPPQSGFTHSQQAYQPPPPPPPHLPQRASHRSLDLYSSRVAPLEPLQPPARAMGTSTPLPPKSSFDLPPINTAMLSTNKLEASSPLSAAAPQSSYFSNASTPQDTHKRSFGNVFSDRHQNGPLRQGARPTTFGSGDGVPLGSALSAADDEDSINGELDLGALAMHYRRADGRTILRALPGHI